LEQAVIYRRKKGEKMKTTLKVGIKAIHAVTFMALFAVALAGCGGGGGGSSSNQTPKNGNWDTMTWDRHHWN
jgi:hypothetical protein